MRVAVIGAGIVGIATAHELAEDGHEVTVFERRASVATEASFANAGVLAPGYVTPWAAPGMLRKVLGQMVQRDAAVRMAGLPSAGLLGWLWRWWRACNAATYAANRGAMLALARDSLERTHALAERHHIDYERARGMLVLLRAEREVAQARAGLKVLADLGVNFHLVDAAMARRIEPALSDAIALKAAIHLPDAEVGNCRQFAHGLRQALAARGVEVRFLHEVQRIEAAARPILHVARIDADPTTGLGDRDVPSTLEPQAQAFDAVVVCAALGTVRLLAPLRLRLPLQPIHGYSITLPVRQFEAHPDVGPRAALMDERFKVAITRLGDRIRVAGSAELAGRAGQVRAAALATLYRVLDDWFPGAARQAQAQTWKGARPMLPDGPPAIGASALPGVWLNTGHGSSGWALACGSARLLADLLAGRSPRVDASRFSPQRW
ncbi:MAG TPA: D-amino acid dehydrogenase [Burkholderiaceae bacterium]|nr:D-amino acid dehydrogenase [Burkholderiaceae bacterium]